LCHMLPSFSGQGHARTHAPSSGDQHSSDDLGKTEAGIGFTLDHTMRRSMSRR
jgi:hypothetical protein